MGSCSELLRACKEGNSKKVKKLLEICKNVNSICDVNDKTLLHYCFQNKTCSDLILETAPELLNVADNSGYTVLHFASIMRSSVVLNYILTKNPDLNKQTNDSRTPLLLSIMSNNFEAVKLLCNANADVNIADSFGVSPLHYICKANFGNEKEFCLQIEIIDLLLQHSANIDSQDSLGRTPLIYTVSSNNMKKMKYLLSCGANIQLRDVGGLSILHYAVSNKNTAIIGMLINGFEFDIESTDKNGCTSLMYACTMSQSNVVQCLIDYGANVNAKDFKNRTAVHFVCCKGDLNSLMVLADHHANLWQPDEDYNFPLHEASYKGHEEIVKFFMNHHSANDLICELVNKRNVNGQTPFHLAAFKDHLRTCQILLNNGADLNIAWRGSNGQVISALDLAKQQSTKELITQYQGKTTDELFAICPIMEESSSGGENEGENQSILNYSCCQNEMAQENNALEITDQLSMILLDASYNGNIEEIKSAVNRGVRLYDVADEFGKNLLHYAIRSKDVFQLLLDLMPGSVNKCDRSGISVLNLMVMSHENSNMKLLLDHSADFNFVDESGRTCLHNSVIYKNIEGLKIINEFVTNKTIFLHRSDKHGKYPLHYATELFKSPDCTSLATEFVAVLQSMNGDLECKDVIGRTPLLLAVKASNVDAVTVLLQHGANVLTRDDSSMCSIHYCCSEGNLMILEALCESTIFDANIPDQNGWTPIFYAVLSCHSEIVQLLIEHGARVDIVDRNGGNICHRAAEVGAVKCLRILMENDANVWMMSDLGFMPLHEAVRLGQREVVEIILNTEDARDHIDIKTGDGKTALHLAAQHNDDIICCLLINKGSNVNELFYDEVQASNVTAFDLATTDECRNVLFSFGGLSVSKIIQNNESGLKCRLSVNVPLSQTNDTNRHISEIEDVNKKCSVTFKKCDNHNCKPSKPGDLIVTKKYCIQNVVEKSNNMQLLNSKSLLLKSSKGNKEIIANPFVKSQETERQRNRTQKVHSSILHYEFVRLNSRITCDCVRLQMRRENTEKLLSPRSTNLILR